jgi:hypothetical protein
MNTAKQLLLETLTQQPDDSTPQDLLRVLLNVLARQQAQGGRPRPVSRVYYSGRSDVSHSTKELLFQKQLQAVRERRSNFAPLQ